MHFLQSKGIDLYPRDTRLPLNLKMDLLLRDCKAKDRILGCDLEDENNPDQGNPDACIHRLVILIKKE